MKTKLLRRIRKQYIIVFYKKGEFIKYSNSEAPSDCYRVENKYSYMRFSYERTKNKCLDWIMKDIRKRYGNNKGKGKGLKVWYNN